MYILIGADTVPTIQNQVLFENGDIDELVGLELKDIIEKATYRIYNLEVPLTNIKTPIFKHGPALITSTKTVSGYLALQTDLLTLANNHILDQGEQGLISTIEVLDRAKIAHLGAGVNLETAKEPYFFPFADKTVGVFACAEHEFSIATDYKAGANPFDPLYTPDYIEAIRSKCDFLIVLYHGGKEHYRYPSPQLQKRCRKLIEKGADLIVCQHSHCVGCEEKFMGATIVYGQGNFLFDDSESEYWKTSLLIAINDAFDISYIPIVKHDYCVRLADDETASTILNGFFERSKQIKDESFVHKRYEEFAQEAIEKYLNSFRGQDGLAFRVGNKISRKMLQKKMVERRFTAKKCVQIQNYLECEAHIELLLTGLKKTIQDQLNLEEKDL